MTYTETTNMFLLTGVQPALLCFIKLTSKNFMPGLTIAAMAAADGHMEFNCSSVREGIPASDTHVKKGSLLCGPTCTHTLRQ